jgi:HEAT repeats
MQPDQSHRRFLALKTLLLGLGSAHVIATAQVYLSNLTLHSQIKALAAAGYVTVPNATALPGLLELKSAFFGGLFFTLTLGSFLWLLAFGFAWFWERFTGRGAGALVLVTILWLCGVAGINVGGFNLFASLYVAIVPLTVFSGYYLATRNREPVKGLGLPLLHIAVVFMIVLLWLPKIDSVFFTNFRDHLLLSNVVGRTLNDFYYRYTLYPAHALKSLKQRQIKVIRTDGVADTPNGEGVLNVLVGRDYLPLEEMADTVLDLKRQEDKLIWYYGGQAQFDSNVADFLEAPGKHLIQLSEAVDNNKSLRWVLFISLMVGPAMALYTVVFYLISWAVTVCGLKKSAPVWGAVGCLLVATSGSYLYAKNLAPVVTYDNFQSALQSRHSRDRLAALEFMTKNWVAAGEFRDLVAPVSQGSPAERMRLARLLGAGRHAEDVTLLAGMLSDPHPNVVCMALQALARRGNEASITAIMQTLETSNHWYVQWYAYRALKSLGWHQTRLP